MTYELNLQHQADRVCRVFDQHPCTCWLQRSDRYASRVTVALIDQSGSVAPEDIEIYRQSLEAISEGLDGGDRVVIAKVSSRAEWRPSLDVTVESSNVRLDQEETLSVANDELLAAIPKLLDNTGITNDRTETHLLESVAAASQAFGPPL